MIKLSADWIVALGLIKKKGLKNVGGRRGRNYDYYDYSASTNLLLLPTLLFLYCFYLFHQS